MRRVSLIQFGCQCLVYSGTYGKEYGRFSSPDYPKPYPTGIDCLLYTFIAGSHEVIEIMFTHFELNQASPDCSSGDFVKVFLHLDREGVNELTPWTGLLCGRDVPRVLYSSGPALVLQLHTRQPQGNYSGFIGTFRFIDKDKYKMDGTRVPGTTCDYKFYRSEGKFYSPRYPSSYAKGTRCSYTFRARARERINVVFEEVNLQNGDISCLEREDVLKIHDGDSSIAPVMAVLCNELGMRELISTSNHLFIEFTTASEWPGQGFRATYRFTPITEDQILGTDGPAVSATRTSCDVVLNSDSHKEGIITSPNFPLPYPSQSNCRYHLIGSGKERVQIIFTHFNLSSYDHLNRECEGKDSLTIYMLIDGEMERTETLCGDVLPTSIMSNGPRLILEFKAQNMFPGSDGFQAHYIFTRDFGIKTGKQLSQYPCAFRFSSEDSKKGCFYSPNYPGNYPRDVECHYLFHGKTFEKVRINFLHFDVEGVLPCKSNSASDYIEFSNYMSRENRNSRHCGQLEPFQIESEGKFFRITFKSNDRLDSSGFNASYDFISLPKRLNKSSDANKALRHIIGRCNILLTMLVAMIITI